ncbi:MAG: rhodanese-like domain-containing protein [Burkholderiales bacterium]
MQQIAAPVLRAWLDNAARTKPLLLDVREAWEFVRCHIDDSQLIPMAQLPQHVNGIAHDAEVVVICHLGVRSLHAARFLERSGITWVYNLAGGIDAWAREVDPTMPRY